MNRFSLVALVLLMASCGQKPEIQSHYYGFENETWEKNTPLEFVFTIKDTSEMFSLDASLRYNERFTFNSLNMSVSLISPSGSSRYKGVSIEMKNSDGTPRGESNEDYLEISFPLYRSLRFNEEGEWILNVMHKMPVDITRGLKGLEFELYPTESK